jgi:uncharacterized protein YkwD
MSKYVNSYRASTRASRVRMVVAGGFAAAAILAVASGDAFAATCAHTKDRPARADEQVVAQATLCVINAQRASHDLSPLRPNARLGAAARAKSQDMVENRYFAHSTPAGAGFVQRIRRSGYMRSARRWRVGQNLAWAPPAGSSPQAIVRSWMHSPPHRRAILTPGFREAGVGIVTGVPTGSSPRGATYTADFGVRR